MRLPGNLVLGIYTQSVSQSSLMTKPQTLLLLQEGLYSCCMKFMVYFFKFQYLYTITEELHRNKVQCIKQMV